MNPTIKPVVGSLAIAATLAFAGCAHVSMSSPGTLSGVDVIGSPTQLDRQVVVRNSGAHLFWTFTLESGDLRWDEEKNDIKGGIVLFDDYCGNDDCYDVLLRIAEREKCDLVDVVFTESSTSGFKCSSYAGLLGGVVGTYTVQACGILRQRSKTSEKEVK